MQVVSGCSKARRVLGLLCRRFYGLASQGTLKHLCISVTSKTAHGVRLSSVGALPKSPSNFPCKLATSKWNNSYMYDDLPNLMDLKPLSERRTELKLGLLFKIVHNLIVFLKLPRRFYTSQQHEFLLVSTNATTITASHVFWLYTSY